ncbi:hypothetical protein B5V46_17270 [Rhodovulum sp. MB263]|nr:hypothetical protein B5V46_17270 [Rhodovulum sp. MB263]
MLRSVSVRSSKINVGSIRDGEKPLGVTGGVTVTLFHQTHHAESLRVQDGMTKAERTPTGPTSRSPRFGGFFHARRLAMTMIGIALSPCTARSRRAPAADF